MKQLLGKNCYFNVFSTLNYSKTHYNNKTFIRYRLSRNEDSVYYISISVVLPNTM